MAKAKITGALVRAAVGAVLGGGFGREVAPRIFGYKNDPAAVNMSTAMDALTGAALGGMGMSRLSKLYKANPLALPLGLGLKETIPVGQHAIHRFTDASEAAARAALRPPPPTISRQVGNFLSSPTARGMGIGAAGAGLGGLVTGLLRAKTKEEEAANRGRAGMVTSDTLKYLIPAMLAGGVITV